MKRARLQKHQNIPGEKQKTKHAHQRRKNQNIPAESCCLQSKSIIVGIAKGIRLPRHGGVAPFALPTQNCIGWRAGAFSGYILIFCLLLGLAKPVTAATLPIASIAAGKVVSINGRQFVKIGTDPVKGSRFMAVTPACLNGYVMVRGTCIASETTMQGWTGCTSLVKPAATGFTQGPTLIDARDGKSYEIRKFADGKCWMVDNLMYGGPTDNCASKTTFSGYGSATPTNTFGTGTYGDCRNNPGDASYGYLYNWQAAMQHPSAYYNTTYTGPTSNVQGLCPASWHLPSGKTGGEFFNLDIANGGTGATQNSCTSASCNFWRPGYNYKGVYSGYSDSSGSLGPQGSSLSLWSASEYSVTGAWYLFVRSSSVYPGSDYNSKNIGFAVRCTKN